MPEGIAVEIVGTGPSILMIHGLGGTSNSFEPLVSTLSLSFTVIRPDLRGSGRSVTAGEVSVAAHVSDMTALLDEHGLHKVHVVGWSYGSIIAQQLAVLHPDRVDSLVLLGPIGEPTPAARKALHARAAKARAAGMVDIADALSQAGTSADTKINQPQTVAFARESLMRQNPEGYAQTCESAAAATAAPLDHIKCRTMVLTGDEDKTAPPSSARLMAESIPDSVFIVLSQCGHWSIFEHPRAVTDSLLNFFLLEDQQMISAKVYRQYNQSELDDEYNNRKRWPEFTDHFAKWTQQSENTRASLPNTLDIAYGEDPIERLDVFPSEETGTPLYVFIHGGYWYSLDKSNYSYVADAMRPNGITTAVLNYGLAPHYDMDTIVKQTRSALAWLYRNAQAIGADPHRIYVTGHSAGGHLATMLLATDWTSWGVDLPQDLVKGVCAIGGIFDLEPIQLSFVNEKLRMDSEEALRNSPVHQTYPTSVPLSLIVAVDESAEYHRQSKAMKDVWSDLGYPVELIVPEGNDHFSVANDLGDPTCSLVTHQLDQMKVAFNGRVASVSAGQ